jgi:hypothetical protein
MIYAKDHKQGYLLDPWDYLGPKRRQLMEQSWADLFREEILNNLPVWELARHYDRSNDRPVKELYTAPGIQILQHMNELTDEETIGQLAFNTKWHYALDIAAAREPGVNVIAPAMGTPKKDAVGLAEFSFSDSGKVMACPQGNAPVTTTHKKGRHTAAFDHDHCNACPLKDKCPVQDGKKHRYLNYDDKARRIAVRRAEEDTDEFKEKYRWRSGIEATMSEYDKKTGVKHLRFRGFGAVQFCVLLKAIGSNLFRATAVKKARKAFPGAPYDAKFVFDGLVLVFKELLAAIFSLLEHFVTFPPGYHEYEAKIAG